MATSKESKSVERRSLLGPVLMSFLGVGCVSVDYRPPTEGPTAKLFARSNFVLFNQGVLWHPTHECTQPRTQLMGVLRSRTIGIPYQEVLPVDIPAGQLFSFSLIGAKTYTSGMKLVTEWCQPVAQFEPKHGLSYEAVYEWIGDYCSITVSKVELSGGQVVARAPEETARTASCSMSHPLRSEE